MKAIMLMLLLSSTFAYAQEEERVMDIDLLSFCEDQGHQETHEEITQEKESICEELKNLEGTQVAPYTIVKKDDDGNQWNIRLHFGFTRSNYHPTDLRIKSDVINVVIKDVEMHERTSAHHYNPKVWFTSESNPLKWIDEPTNTFTLSLEKKNNIIYITAYHPKYLRSLVYTEKEVDGETQYDFSPIRETTDFSEPIPENHKFLYLGNTHMNMNWQIGYGRRFVVFDSKKAGKLSYTVKGDVGVSTGKARSIHIIPGKTWDDYNDKYRVQGLNASIGHRVDYQFGRVSLFVDQKYMHARQNHAFYDGTVEYNLNSTLTTFGIGIDIFKTKKRR